MSCCIYCPILQSFDPMVIKKKIRVNALCPDAILTTMLRTPIVEPQYQPIVSELAANSTGME